MGTELATTSIEVVLAVGYLEVFYPVTNTVQTNIIETYSYALRGGGFQPGTVTVYIDSLGGTMLGTPIEIQTGDTFKVDFVWPRGFTGAHAIVAEEIVSGQTIKQTANIMAEALPS